jgi:hypothetical protein
VFGVGEMLGEIGGFKEVLLLIGSFLVSFF